MHWEDGEGTCVRSKPGQVRRPPSPRRLRVLEAHYVQPRRRPLRESRALTPSSPRRADRLHRLLRPVPLALALAARLGRQLARRVPAFALPVAARSKGGRARAADVRRGERDGARGLGRGRAAQVPDGCVPSSLLRSVQLCPDALSLARSQSGSTRSPARRLSKVRPTSTAFPVSFADKRSQLLSRSQFTPSLPGSCTTAHRRPTTTSSSTTSPRCASCSTACSARSSSPRTSSLRRPRREVRLPLARSLHAACPN